jgi:hypothetical protein
MLDSAVVLSLTSGFIGLRAPVGSTLMAAEACFYVDAIMRKHAFYVLQIVGKHALALGQ